MHRLKYCADFDKEMAKVLSIMEVKGFIVEFDHPYAYSMQYPAAFNDVSEWLERNGYDGTLDTQGYFDSHAGSVYGLYDTDRVSYEEMHRELIAEGKRQARCDR